MIEHLEKLAKTAREPPGSRPTSRLPWSMVVYLKGLGWKPMREGVVEVDE